MATAIDPICQMDVNTDNPSGGQSEHNDRTYYFCAPGCKVAFDKEPEKYMSEAHDEYEDHDHEDHDHNHEDHEGHDHGDHEGHGHGAQESHDFHDDHDDNGDHDHGPGGHSHGHHMPERPAASGPAAKKPGFFARLFGKK